MSAEGLNLFRSPNSRLSAASTPNMDGGTGILPVSEGRAGWARAIIILRQLIALIRNIGPTTGALR